MRFGHWLLLLVALNAIVRLPLLADPANVSPDGAEYLAVARSLRSTYRYRTDLKWQFFSDDPVRHDAWPDRPPLYPYFAALCGAAFPFLDPVTAARAGNVAAACAALVVAAFLLRRLFGERAALLAAGFSFLLPHTLYWTAQPTTESLTLLLTLAAFLTWSGRGEPGGPTARLSPARGLGTGLLAGLLYLVRPTGALLLAVFLAEAWFSRRKEGSAGSAPRVTGPVLAGLAVGFLMAALPYHARLWLQYGSPFHSALAFTFAVRTTEDVTFYGFENPPPSAVEFLLRHAGELPGLVMIQAGRHAEALLVPLLALLPFAAGIRAADLSGPLRPAALYAAATLLFHTAAWCARGSQRYFQVCLIFLAGALIARALRPCGYLPLSRRLCLGGTALGLALGVTGFLAAQSRPDRGLPLLPRWRAAAERVRGAGLVATDNPWMLNLLAETPAVMLPRTADPALLERFLVLYGPEVMVLFADEAAEQEMARAWRAARLPAGWRLEQDDGVTLIASPEGAPPPSEPPAPAE